MLEEQPKPAPSPSHDSRLYGVSVRAWLAILMTLTVCVLSGFRVAITEPLYSGFLLGLGFYFGQKTQPPK
jgi:hypothetical protein